MPLPQHLPLQPGNWSPLNDFLTVGHNIDGTLKGGAEPLGTYLPQGWNANFLASLGIAATQPSRIAIVGDSVGQGYYTSDLRTKPWSQLLRASLQASSGDGGSGYVSATLSDGFAAGPPLSAGARARYATNGWNAQTGTWARDNILPYGPGGQWGMLSTDLGTPASMTFTVRGTSIKIFTRCNGGANANYTYQIDGGSIVGVSDGAGTNIQVTTVAVAAGTHTVKVTYNGDGVKTLYLLGVAGENATGVVVNNYSVFGSSSTHAALLTAFTDGSVTPDWQGGYKYPADLGVYCLGLNDASANVVTETYAQNVRRWLKAVRDGGATSLNGNISAAVIVPHVGTFDASTRNFQNYMTYLRGVCEAYGAALLSFWALGRNSWNYWNSLNYWGNGTDPTVSGTDTVHPSDAGHAYMQSIIQPFLVTAV